MNKMKIINWIKWMYTEYDLKYAEREIRMFISRAEYLGLIDTLSASELKDYNDDKYKLGQDLDEYEEYLKENNDEI